MIRPKLSEEEWHGFLEIADRLGIPVRGLLDGQARFSAMEAAGHALGRAVAQAATERLALTQAERMTGPQPCPTCGRQCPLVHRKRDLETIDGPVELAEPACHCSDCRRDFFPSAFAVGTGSEELQRRRDG